MAAETGLGQTLLPSPGHDQQGQVLLREGENSSWMLDDSLDVWECSCILNLKPVLLAEPASNKTINPSTNP